MGKILFSGGGSLGHITPSVAVWNQWLKRHPEDKCLFVCADRPDERELLNKLQLPFAVTASPRLRFSFPYVFVQALWQNWRILHKFKPDLVFSKGGFISVPTCIVAYILGIPIIVHESDAVSGRANTLIRYIAKKVCYGLPRDSYTKKQVHTGNPVRTSMYSGNKEQGLTFTGLTGKKPILLVSGGSQGSKALNEAVWNQLDELLKSFEVVHITGRGKLSTISSKLTANGYFVTEFVTRELADLYAIADIALTRASASTIAEMQANSITMLLCPLRGVGHDHQQKNAEAMQAAGLAAVVQQVDLAAELVPNLLRIRGKKNAKKAPENSSDASARICTELERYIFRAN